MADGSNNAQALGTALLDGLTVEPDRGLWEPLRIANEMFPDLTPDERCAMVEGVLLDLLSKGDITLYCSPRTFPDPPERLTLDEALAEVRAGWWREDPLDRGYVWVGSRVTDA